METSGKILIYELHLCARGAKTLKLTKTHQPKIVEGRLTSAKPYSVYTKLLEERLSLQHRLRSRRSALRTRAGAGSPSRAAQNRALMGGE